MILDLDLFLYNLESALESSKSKYSDINNIANQFEELKNYILNDSKEAIKKFSSHFSLNTKNYFVELLTDNENYRISIQNIDNNHNKYKEFQKNGQSIFIYFKDVYAFKNEHIYYNFNDNIYISTSKIYGSNSSYNITINNNLKYSVIFPKEDYSGKTTLISSPEKFCLSFLDHKIKKDINTTKENTYTNHSIYNISVSDDPILKSISIDLNNLHEKKYYLETKTIFKNIIYSNSNFIINSEVKSIKDFPLVLGKNIEEGISIYQEYQDIKALSSDVTFKQKNLSLKDIQNSLIKNQYLIDFLFNYHDTIKKALSFKNLILKTDMNNLDLSQNYNNLCFNEFIDIYESFKNITFKENNLKKLKI